MGEGAPNEIPDGWIVLPKGSKKEVVLPEQTIDWFTQNKRTLSVVAHIVRDSRNGEIEHPFLGEVYSSVVGLEQLPEILENMGDQGDLEIIAEVKDTLWKTVKSLEQQVNEEVEKAMDDAKLNLSGAELLEALSDGASFQRRLQEATNDVIAEAMEKAKQSLGETLNGTEFVARTIFLPHNGQLKLIGKSSMILTNH